MERINCYWEMRNLNKKTLEIIYSDKDSYEDILEAEEDYEYIVLKTKNASQNFNKFQKNGYKYVENQFSLSKKIDSKILEDKKIKRFSQMIDSEEVNSEDDLKKLLELIDNDQFDTDRIFLDNQFSKETSSTRYKNWIKDEFVRGSKVIFIKYKGKRIGFLLFKVENTTYNALLGGIFNEFKNLGLGISIILLPIKISLNLNLKKIKTKISSNNLEVLKLYNFLNYRIDNLETVFVKHRK